MAESLQVKFKLAFTALIFSFLLFNVYKTMSPTTSDSSLRVYAIRIKPNEDLRNELLKFISEKNLKAAFIMTCVGSLKKATIRLANTTDIKVLEEPLEIVSLVGLLSAKDGHHLHISVSDKNGTTYGGHVYGEMLVYTTAELVIGECSDYVFKRELDTTYGYNELVVYDRARN